MSPDPPPLFLSRAVPLFEFSSPLHILTPLRNIAHLPVSSTQPVGSTRPEDVSSTSPVGSTSPVSSTCAKDVRPSSVPPSVAVLTSAADYDRLVAGAITMLEKFPKVPFSELIERVQAYHPADLSETDFDASVVLCRSVLREILLCPVLEAIQALPPDLPETVS